MNEVIVTISIPGIESIQMDIPTFVVGYDFLSEGGRPINDLAGIIEKNLVSKLAIMKYSDKKQDVISPIINKDYGIIEEYRSRNGIKG